MAKLGEIATVQSGGTPARSKKEYWQDGCIPWVKISDIKDKYVKTTEEKITEQGLNNSSAKIFSAGTILYTIFATLGETAVLDIDAATNQAIVGIMVTDKRVLPEFLYYYLVSQKENVVKMGRGVAQNNINMALLRDFEVPIFEQKKQKIVIRNLERLDNLILLRKQQLAKLDELVKARFVEMFGEPSSNPMGWLQTTVGAECYYIKDGPHKSLTDVGMENGYPFISVRNIVNGYIDFSTAKYISEADYKDAIKKCCPEKGDILYSKGGTTGIAKLVDIDIKFANWVHLAVLKFNHNEFNGAFFEKMLNCDYCYKQSQMLTKGIANRDLVLSAMAQIKIYKPPILLQNQFATFVERVDQQKQTVQQSLEKLELMKKALMQEYFG
mgnify:CR=1 FL=1